MKKLVAVFLVTSILGPVAGKDIAAHTRPFNHHRTIAERILFSGSGREWNKNEMTGSGFFFNLSVFFPDPSYLNPTYGSNNIRYNMGNEIELGNFFRFVSFSDNMIGIGIRATWLQAGYTTAPDAGATYQAIQVSLLRAGPQIAFGLTEKMAIEVFYQIGVNYTMDLWKYQDWNSSDHYIGASHEIGAAYRFKIFSVGGGYRFGNLAHIVSTDNDPQTENGELSTVKTSIDNLRLFVGLKF